MDYEDVVKYQRRLMQTRLASGKSLIELTTYDHVAMWWFVDFEFNDFLARQLDKSSPSEPARKGVSIARRAELLSRFLESFMLRLLPQTSKQTSSEAKDENRPPRILFTAQDLQWREIRNQQTGSVRKTDVFFDSILKRLAGRCEFVGVCLLPIPHPALLDLRIRAWQVFVDKWRKWPISQVPFERHFSTKVWRKTRDASSFFAGVWQNLLTDRVFREICDKGTLREAILSELEYYFHTAFPRATMSIEMSRQMIENLNPNLILMLNEYGLFERSLIVAGKKLGVPTLAIQHGMISSHHRGYTYSRDEVSPFGSVTTPYCPIPDRTAVYGPYYKRLLTEVSSYPEHTVVVTGAPSYDRMAHLNRTCSKRRFLESHKIEPNRRILLWTTQCHGMSTSENIQNFEVVLEAMQHLDATTLVIKQHPGEGRKHTEMIKHFLAEYDVSAILTPGDSDLHEQLCACDLMISKDSTTIIEAVALGKPVVILNLSGDAVQDYVKEGIAVEVSGQGKLASVIRKLLADDTRLAKNRRSFVGKYLYKIDGKATDRVVGLMAEMVGNRRTIGTRRTLLWSKRQNLVVERAAR